ncbi:hypothetical protein Ga0074812_108179 [Parafrankia irregularis]|uniref:Acyl-protein synthetase, LuxE n=1 Tax=Parafrankia irregularis TaxID=795642 RepID=A0A0S4QLU9_9ACTN|nr:MULTISPECIES: hypothetical protein [Parafrankia]MBE3200157.1 hypothetical protein [Parafrankia sp. CH37]CUU56651.1 hypothetical protein Ga0074812_108179 [Parafrankia irregularis]
MTTAHEELLGHVADPRFHELPRTELEPLWIEAAGERLAVQRERIPVLGKLADELGIDRISSFQDLVPLLFAHSSYKSYPESFVNRGRWPLLTRWLDTLSSRRITEVDVAGVTDQEGWLGRLDAAGCVVLVSSGTTGKSSFLPSTRADSDLALRSLVAAFGEQRGIVPKQDRAVFVLGPRYGPHRSALHFRTIAEEFGRPDARFFLSEEPLQASDQQRAADLRKRIAAGTALPNEIAELERSAAANQRLAAERLDALIDKLIAHRSEPMIIGGFWAQYWTIVERARARGVRPGEFHPETIVTGGGGTKGADLPPDYETQILEFFGIPRANVQSGYGMSELSAAAYEVAGRYRPAPWVIPLILDDSGTQVLPLEGESVTGRFAFLDLAVQGRWGGVVTGDRVTVDLTTPNLSIVPGGIVRYSLAEGGDDKLTCAGTVDAYVRGVMTS